MLWIPGKIKRRNTGTQKETLRIQTQRVPKKLKEQGWIRRTGLTYTQKSVSKIDNPKGFPPFFFLCPFFPQMGFPGGSNSEESACNAGDLGSIPGSGRYPEKEMSTYSNTLAWRIPWTEEPWWATVHGVSRELDMTEWLILSHIFNFPPTNTEISESLKNTQKCISLTCKQKSTSVTGNLQGLSSSLLPSFTYKQKSVCLTYTPKSVSLTYTQKSVSLIDIPQSPDVQHGELY